MYKSWPIIILSVVAVHATPNESQLDQVCLSPSDPIVTKICDAFYGITSSNNVASTPQTWDDAAQTIHNNYVSEYDNCGTGTEYKEMRRMAMMGELDPDDQMAAAAVLGGCLMTHMAEIMAELEIAQPALAAIQSAYPAPETTAAPTAQQSGNEGLTATFWVLVLLLFNKMY